MSRGFVSTLAGIAMTLLAWYGPWAWPGAPAFAVIRMTFGTDSNFADLEFRMKALFVILLIVVNVATWAAVVRSALALLHRGARSERSAA